MIVHKATMGVLDYIWTGEYRRDRFGCSTPAMRSATLEDFPELDPEEWWEVPPESKLARYIRLYYPMLRSVETETGDLAWVEMLREDAPSPEDDAEDRSSRRCGRRARDLMPFLKKHE